ncbi:MAG: MotA/TolQ/ExbB proton channel family protein [Oligoflexia bacterium]|nr:MotA/TolQ/ExbB proton channel family protein [Oligoflexia bacterium]
MWNSRTSSAWMGRWGGERLIGERELDQGILYGAIISSLLIGIGIIFSGQILSFLNPGSLFIVVGGTFGATLVHFSLVDLRRAWREVEKIIFLRQTQPRERISFFVELSQKIKKNGIMVLEGEAESAREPFLKKSLELTVDGQPEQELRRILEIDMRSMAESGSRTVHVFETMGNYAPAMGLIGTLIGLIQMLSALDNPAAVGPAMAQALVTTFYGAVLSNLVFQPFAGKLRARNDADALVQSITIEGAASLAKRENPIVIEQRLQGFFAAIPEETASSWQRAHSA